MWLVVVVMEGSMSFDIYRVTCGCREGGIGVSLISAMWLVVAVTEGLVSVLYLQCD